MFTKRLFNVLVVLILGVVAFFALRVAAETGTPGQYSSRYGPGPAGQIASTDSNFPSGKFIKAGTTERGFIFNKDGTYTGIIGDLTLVNGTYKVVENIFTETSNNATCETNVSFKYTFDGKNITFSYIGNPEDDPCGGRRDDFNNVTYTLVE